MRKKIIKQTKRFRLAVGMVFLAGLITIVGCNKNGANSSTSSGNKEISPGTVVKNNLGMEFTYIPAGSFQMGKSSLPFTSPVHQVTFAKGFYMGRYEVTQEQWGKIMDSDLSNKNCGQNCPVEEIRWNKAQEFIQKLNAQNDGYQYHLPSEAEWEYACRAGTTGDYAGDPAVMAWYMNNSDDKTHPVGQKQPNAWGLYDMHGNVAEWVMDYWHDTYDGAPTDGSAWVSGGEQKRRVIRGGSYGNNVESLTSAYRLDVSPEDLSGDHGFRLVAVSQPKP